VLTVGARCRSRRRPTRSRPRPSVPLRPWSRSWRGRKSAKPSRQAPSCPARTRLTAPHTAPEAPRSREAARRWNSVPAPRTPAQRHLSLLLPYQNVTIGRFWYGESGAVVLSVLVLLGSSALR